MRDRRRVTWIAGLTPLLVFTLMGTAMAAGKPSTETVTFSDTFEDAFLTDACGVDVTTSVDGRITFFSFANQPIGPQDITSVHVNFVATAGDNAVRFKDVGIDMVRVEPDGTLVLMIVGQLPFEFTGVLMIDLTTGEAILEPHHFVDTTRACHLLTR
jgi:hypothetical protein